MSAWGLAGIAGLLVFQYGVLLLLLKKNWKQRGVKSSGYPMVSILVSARNEEEHLPRLLRSLAALDYPAEKLEILLADDQSSDRTAEISAVWAKGHPNRRLFSIRKDQVGLYQANGKANALAILAKEASGEFFFFTDADCEVPAAWIREGLGSFLGKTGIVIGVTQVKGGGFFGRMQELEWWNTLGIVKAVTDLGLPTTGLGNNMAISREAYLASGGFEGIKSSITEDLEISKSICKAGFAIHHQVSERMLVRTKAEKDWPSLLRQRKRWVTGAATLSFGWKVLLVIQGLFFPAAIALLCVEWKLGLGIWVSKAFFQGWFLCFFARKSGQKIAFFPLIFFDFYQVASLSLTILYYFWPSKVQWKSRNYP